MKKDFKRLTLNLSNDCNLDCNWCYRQSFACTSISRDLFDEFYYSIIADNIETVVLIGGEPTITKDFFYIMERLSTKKTEINSNGLMFYDKRFLSTFNNVINPDKTIIKISIKGYNDRTFKTTTGYDYFQKMCLAIDQVQNTDFPLMYSYTYDSCMSEIMQQEFLHFLHRLSIRDIVINDIRPYFIKKGNKIFHPSIIDGLPRFIEFLQLNGVRTYVRLNRPLCDYNRNFVNKLLNEERLIVRCSVKSGGGLWFSPSLELQLCNGIDIVLGKYGKDFQNYNELLSYFSSDAMTNIFNRLSGYPRMKCISCDYWTICGGGCILRWT